MNKQEAQEGQARQPLLARFRVRKKCWQRGRQQARVDLVCRLRAKSFPISGGIVEMRIPVDDGSAIISVFINVTPTDTYADLYQRMRREVSQVSRRYNVDRAGDLSVDIVNSRHFVTNVAGT